MDDSRSLHPLDVPNSGQANQPSRNALLSKLVWAAKHLADKHVVDCTPFDQPEARKVMCLTCAATGSALPQNTLRHHPSCAAGQVLAILGQLVEQAAAQAGRRDRNAEFGEPWRQDDEFPSTIVQADGYAVCDLSLNDLSAEDEEPYGRRIIACVNACAGVPTERLEAASSRSIVRLAASDLHGIDALFGCKSDDIKPLEYPEGGVK